jgi:hypothetical protein
MKIRFIKLVLIISGIMSIIGLFPVVGLYPVSYWGDRKDFWRYLFSFKGDNLWKIALFTLLIGIVMSFIFKLTNRFQILIFFILGIFISFIAAYVGINRLLPSSSLIIYPMSVVMFILVIVYSAKAKTSSYKG